MELTLLKIVLVLFCSIVVVSGAQRQSYLIPERKSDVTVNGASSNAIPYEYQIVPSSEYAMASYQPEESSILNYVLSPFTAIMSVGSTALTVAHWMITKGSLVLVGIAIVIGFCGLTPYCTMTIEYPFGRGLPQFSYLNDIQYYFNEAYKKYYEMQGGK